MALHQVRASDVGAGTRPTTTASAPASMPLLETEELTILTCWAEGVAEAAAYAPARVGELSAEARADAPWRAELGLPDLSPRLANAIDSLGRVVRGVAAPPDASLFDALLTAAGEDHPEEETLDGLVRDVLLSMLEERRTRQPTQANPIT